MRAPGAAALVALALGACTRPPPAPIVAAAPDAAAPPPAGFDGGSEAPALDGGAGELNHVLCTGQSLAVGVGGKPALSTTQPFDALMFSAGVKPEGEGALDALAPLVESGQETMSTAFAAEVHELAAPSSHRLLVSANGVGGVAYSGLKKGTRAYTRGLEQVAAAARLARARGVTLVVRAVTNVHGESDHALQNLGYERDLVEWQADYERDVRAATGQASPVPMLHTQVSSWTKLGQATSPIPGAQLAASVKSDGKIVLVGPKYQLAYAKDGIHLSNEGYRHMGEYYAKVYTQVVVLGRRWEPLRPRSITLVGDVVRVVFHVPVPPLVIDTALVARADAYGFEYTDDSPVPPRITEVTLDGADAVRIKLSAAPTAAGRRVRYAYTGTPNARGGPREGPRGNLRDSDETPSRHKNPLYDWAVHFDEPVR